MSTIQMLPWLFAVLVAAERLLHLRSRGRGSRWFAVAFILCAAAAVLFLIGNPPALVMRAVLGVVALVTGVAGGAYAAPNERQQVTASTT